MTDVFLSYSRKDKAFVQTLHDALHAEQREIWVDWQAIPLTADWWHEIERGIEGTNTFVFVISPDSVASDICRDEIDHAVKHNKRLVPIVRREGFEMSAVHPMLSKHNWLFFRETDEFDRGFADLVRAIETDLEYVRSHTRLTERAVEWEGKQRNESFLLRGMDLAGAEDWLVQGASKQPQVTELQGEFINTSRRIEGNRQKAFSDVFISYSREDKPFVQKLYEALQLRGRSTWVDWDAIGLAEDWRQAIARGIEGANTFVFVISPDSITSFQCLKEIDHAVKHNKRLAAILIMTFDYSSRREGGNVRESQTSQGSRSHCPRPASSMD
jgi:TIR domain